MMLADEQSIIQTVEESIAHDGPTMGAILSKLYNIKIFFSEWQMRMATSVHHTNPRSATLDFWRKTTRFEDYKLIQAKRRAQMNRPTRFN